MKLETSVRLQAAEEPVEMEGGPIRVPTINGFIRKEGTQFCVVTHQTGKKMGCYPSRAEAQARLTQISRFKAAGLRPPAQGQQGGWQYGFRHPIGYIPQRTLTGFPRTGKTGSGAGNMGVPKIPTGPGVARRPNPSIGRSVKGPGMMQTSPSLSRLRVKLAADSEAAEPPQTGAYSYTGGETKRWFDDPIKKKVKATGTSEGAEKGWENRERPTVEERIQRRKEAEKNKIPGLGPKRGKPKPGDLNYRPPKIREVPENVNPRTKSLTPVKMVVGDLTPEQIRRFKEVGRLWKEGKLEADVDGEPTGTMQHAHLDANLIFHPPSLTKRKKADYVPTDDPGETDNKWLDVDKRNSKATWEQRMKLLKRSAPGGLPAQIPARTTLIPMHQGVSTPAAMYSAAERPRLRQRPVNWDRQARQRTSYDRRGAI